MVDVVTVFHRDENYLLAQDLQRSLKTYEQVPFKFIGVDNREENRGFARGCNLGAAQGTAPIIGFLNPDVEVTGEILTAVTNAFAINGGLMVTGENFGKDPQEYQRHWGCEDWVCGAAMFVRRTFWTAMAGFDTQFVWGWEETDLIRRAQVQFPGEHPVRSMRLPIRHTSPEDNPPEDAQYKAHHFERGARLFRNKWGIK